MKNGDVIWRAGGGVVRQTPFLATVHNARDGTRYRGGQCIDVTADSITVKYHAEAHDVRTATVARSLKPAAVKGDPLVCELAASGYGIAALHDGQFIGAGPGGDQAQAVDAGFFHPSRIMDAFWNL